MCNNNSLSFFHSLLGSIPRRLRRIISCHAERVSASIRKTLKQVQGDVTNTRSLMRGYFIRFVRLINYSCSQDLLARQKEIHNITKTVNKKRHCVGAGIVITTLHTHWNEGQCC